MEKYLHTIIAILAVINPLVCGAMLLQLGQGRTRNQNIYAGLKAMLAVFIILVIAIFGGQYILHVFGISMDAFKIVGGIILAVIGFHMLVGFNKNNTNNSQAPNLRMLILFAASPGTIVMVMTLAVAHNEGKIPITALIGTAIAVAITIVVMVLMQFFSSNKKSSSQGIASSFLGLIIAAMGLQFMLSGLKNFF